MKFLFKRFFTLTFLISLLISWNVVAWAQAPFPLSAEKEKGVSQVEVTADNLEYVRGEKKLIARGNAIITYQGTELIADYAEVFMDTKKAYERRNVSGIHFCGQQGLRS